MEVNEGQRSRANQGVFVTQTTHDMYKEKDKENDESDFIESSKSVTFNDNNVIHVKEMCKKKRSFKDEMERSYLEAKRKENLIKFEQLRLGQSRYRHKQINY